MTELLTPEQAAHRLSVCTKTLRRLRQDGHIRYVAITDRKIRYRPEDCDDYVASRARKAPECPSTKRVNRRTSTTTSSSKVVDFTARRAQRPSGRR
ncbi:helix-turn-helix domain-containing protein [Sphingomonas pseudosanguinis]|uniref:helix-turn-helix domain-containing protein n=1 Tax=Sphingomonas pseudosanguinis TaxID=413712 RepID=UPI0016186861|nr:helix-turn-helix domain-containing protein [Sphingomonas pseudosanguinis]